MGLQFASERFFQMAHTHTNTDKPTHIDTHQSLHEVTNPACGVTNMAFDVTNPVSDVTIFAFL